MTANKDKIDIHEAFNPSGSAVKNVKLLGPSMSRKPTAAFLLQKKYIKWALASPVRKAMHVPPKRLFDKLVWNVA